MNKLHSDKSNKKMRTEQKRKNVKGHILDTCMNTEEGISCSSYFL